MNKKVIFLLLLLLPLQSISAQRIVYFNNKIPYLPENRFSYFLFSWHTPDETERDGRIHELNPSNSREFPHFPKQIDLDALKPRYGRTPIPSSDIVDLKIVTDQPSGLKTRGPEPKIIYLTGSKRNLKPGVYDVVVSNFAIHLNYKGPKK